ncbi:MAG: hypothetical protein V1776_02155 [Candidatus Diapherotrites archaeon]
MRSRRSINRMRGQVSLEALLLWAGFFAILAGITPFFIDAFHAQEALIEKSNRVQFIDSLSYALHSLSFMGEGSVRVLSLPSSPSYDLSGSDTILLVEWVSPSGKNQSIEIASIIPIVGVVDEDVLFIRLVRQRDYIQLESG